MPIWVYLGELEHAQKDKKNWIYQHFSFAVENVKNANALRAYWINIEQNNVKYDWQTTLKRKKKCIWMLYSKMCSWLKKEIRSLCKFHIARIFRYFKRVYIDFHAYLSRIVYLWIILVKMFLFIYIFIYSLFLFLLFKTILFKMCMIKTFEPEQFINQWKL